MGAKGNASDVRTGVAVLVLMAGSGLMGGFLLVTFGGTVLVTAAAFALLLWLTRRFDHMVPYGGSPWYRVVAVTTLLIVALILVPGAWGQSLGAIALTPIVGGPGVTAGFGPLGHAAALAVLLVVFTVLGEYFFRGVVYSLLLDWRGPGAAIVGSSLALAGVALTFAPQEYWPQVVLSLVGGVVLAGSRWWTESVVPALLAQTLLAVSGAAFLLLLGLDGQVG